MRTPLVPFSDLVEPSPDRVDHLMLSLSLVGTSRQPLCRPIRFPPRASACAYLTSLRFTCEPKDPVCTSRKGRAGKSPRTPSVVSRTCEPKPTSRPCAYVFSESASSRTGSPFLGSCPASAVLRASFRLAPCSSHHDLLREPRWTRRAMRPTNFCHPNDDTCTRTSCVPDSLRGFHRVDVPRALGARATWSRDRVLHGTRERFGGSVRDTRCLLLPLASTSPCLGCASESVGVFFPRRLLRPSLWHLCRNSLLRGTGRAFALPSGARLRLSTSRRVRAFVRVRKPPRSPWPPARESRWHVTSWGAFHRQGPFVGSGGLYSPGPATASPPFRVMRRPLNDVLTSPWVLAGPPP